MLYEIVKKALRRTSDAFDDEIRTTVDAGVEDLRSVGLQLPAVEEITDPMVIMAVVLYCKGYYGYNPDSERFIKSYEHNKILLSLKNKSSGEVTDAVE